MPEAILKSFRLCFSALFLAAAYLTPAAADPAKTSSIPFLGELPRDTAIETKVVDDIRQFPAGELDALMNIIHLCELNRANLARRRLYDAWQKRCKRTEKIWITKYRNMNDRRMIDAQMRVYHGRRLSLIQAASNYFAQKDTIALKIRRGEDITQAVADALRLRKKLFGISDQIIKFFFALKDLFIESRR